MTTATSRPARPTRTARDHPEYARRRAAWAPIFAVLDRNRAAASRADVAATLGISKQLLSSYETGKTRPPEWIIADLCKLTRVPKRTILAPLGPECGPRDFYLQPYSRVRRAMNWHHSVPRLPVDGDEESNEERNEPNTPYAALAAR